MNFDHQKASKLNLGANTKRSNELKSDKSLSDGSGGSTRSGESPDHKCLDTPENKGFKPSGMKILCTNNKNNNIIIKNEEKNNPDPDETDPENLCSDEDEYDNEQWMIQSIQSLDEKIKIPYYDTQD
jgi:hypothetical protein